MKILLEKMQFECEDTYLAVCRCMFGVTALRLIAAPGPYTVVNVHARGIPFPHHKCAATIAATKESFP